VCNQGRQLLNQAKRLLNSRLDYRSRTCFGGGAYDGVNQDINATAWATAGKWAARVLKMRFATPSLTKPTNQGCASARVKIKAASCAIWQSCAISALLPNQSSVCATDQDNGCVCICGSGEGTAGTVTHVAVVQDINATAWVTCKQMHSTCFEDEAYNTVTHRAQLSHT